MASLLSQSDKSDICQAPNLVVQAPASPFSPAKPSHLLKESVRRVAQDNVRGSTVPGNTTEHKPTEAQTPLNKQQALVRERKRGGGDQLLALSAAVIVGLYLHTSTLRSTPTAGSSGFLSIDQWRANAAEEWRLSPESKLSMDWTYEEASATSAVRAFPPNSFDDWRSAAAFEWRHSSESRYIYAEEELSPVRRWSKFGGLGAWREFAANSWKTSAAAKLNVNMSYEHSLAFSMYSEPFSVSFVPEHTSSRHISWGSADAA